MFFSRLGQFVNRFWFAVILIWLVVAILVTIGMPRWSDVTYDGNLAYLPERMPSVQGQKVLDEAFPFRRAKSQIVIAVVREQSRLQSYDFMVADDLVRRFLNLQAAACMGRGQKMQQQVVRSENAGDRQQAASWKKRSLAELGVARDALDEAIQLDRVLLNKDYLGKKDRLIEAYHNRALLNRWEGKQDEFKRDFNSWRVLSPQSKRLAELPLPTGTSELPLLDIWTRHSETVHTKLLSEDRQAQLMVLQLSTEFMASENVDLLERVDVEIAKVRQQAHRDDRQPVQFGISGSAAVGGDILRSSADAIRYTELFTIALIVIILAGVYRSPLLVLIPLITIAIATVVSIGSVALLTQLDRLPGWEWWDFKVFTTTRIFIGVILFGAGTDYCLFMISRYREELANGAALDKALPLAMTGVGDALTASAMTTIIGLAMMYFAEFGKFRNSGPAISWCLMITLTACLTLAPALLRAFGRPAFWPQKMLSGRHEGLDRNHRNSRPEKVGLVSALWNWLARRIVTRPGWILIGSFVALSPFAWIGNSVEISYDLLAQLADGRPSKQGTALMSRHFAIGESGPIIVIAKKMDGGFEAPDRLTKFNSLTAIRKLSAELNDISGVQAVRSLAQPLGDETDGGITSRRGLRRWIMPHAKIVREFFLTQIPEWEGDITRFELVLDHDPFSMDAARTLEQVNRLLEEESSRVDSFWLDTNFTYSGTTAAIADLREVTQSDTWRIQTLVVVAVLGVLLVIIRRPLVCLYMIASVLFSYFVALGMTEVFFQLFYGETFQGLDWKVPIFLFVILVAIGQDYNVYLATRVFQEQDRHGPFGGLQRAVVKTGGIITSCGVIMAGTFLTMTSGLWTAHLPWIQSWGGPPRGIVELGFALAVGVLLDTLVVRPLLLPAFLALLIRWKLRKPVAPSAFIRSRSQSSSDAVN